jgi:pyruvate formate lyase activating enzyme
LIIGGFTKLSTVDWPGKLAAVVFTRGCNFRCPWCHNKSLVWPELYGPEVPEAEIIAYLEKRKNYLDGVVVTGGEPTVQANLSGFLRKVKDIGLPVKLDTNGSYPEVLEHLIKGNLVDALALDVKAPLEKYPKVTGVSVNTEAVCQSFRLAAASSLPVWFRTTLIPELNKSDIERIKRTVEQLKPKTAVHVFQEYRKNWERS